MKIKFYFQNYWTSPTHFMPNVESRKITIINFYVQTWNINFKTMMKQQNIFFELQILNLGFGIKLLFKEGVTAS